MSKVTVTVEEMTNIELIEDRLEHLQNSAGTIYATTSTMFQEKTEKMTGSETAEPIHLLLTSMGAHAAAIQAICDKLKIQLEVLKDLESEETSDNS